MRRAAQEEGREGNQAPEDKKEKWSVKKGVAAGGPGHV